MNRQVGFARNINIEWLSSVAQYAIAGLSREEAKEKLDEEISMKISSVDNRRKTKDILLHVWYDNDPKYLERAKTIYPQVGSSEKLAVHWSLMMLYFPIFCDLSTTIGHILNYKDTISTEQVKEAIYAKWGQRQTLVHALSKNMQTMKDIGAIYEAEKRGQYKIKEHTVSDCGSVGMLLVAVLKAEDKPYVTWQEFISHPALFPFEITNLDESYMASLGYFTLARFNNQVVIQLCE